MADGRNADKTTTDRTKGLDFIDREKAKYEAKRQAEEGTLVFFLFVVFLPSFLWFWRHPLHRTRPSRPIQSVIVFPVYSPLLDGVVAH